MKSCYRIGLPLLIGVFLGALLMGFYQREILRKQSEDLDYYVQKKSDDWAFEVYQSRIIEGVNTLFTLRHGEIDYLIGIKEEALSAEIDAFHVTFPQLILSNTNSIKILRTAARYRAEYPFKTGNPDVDQVVERLLKEAQNKN